MSNYQLGRTLIFLVTAIVGCDTSEPDTARSVAADRQPEAADTAMAAAGVSGNAQGATDSFLPATTSTDLAQEFVCPPDAKDSGPWEPGHILRWCEESEPQGRPLFHGPVWRWYRSGQIQSKEFYFHGAADGDWQQWYEDGTLALNASFERGRRVGKWEYWDSAGALAAEIRFERDSANRTDYYASGQRKAVGNFVSTGKNGQWTYWNEDGTVAARCDFGTGLFELPTDECRLIAEELAPTGYSRPVPFAEVSQDTVVLTVADLSYRFTRPQGWVTDTEAGESDLVPVVLYPQGRAWRDPGANMYLRVLFTDGRSFEETVASELESFARGVAQYSELTSQTSWLDNGTAMIAKTITYKPYVNVESPFPVVEPDTVYEQVAYLDVSNRVVLVAVLACNSESALEEVGPLFEELVRSVRY